jgi:hypothetical protein
MEKYINSDLIYEYNSEIGTKISNNFDITIKSVWDEIHGERAEIFFKFILKKDWYKFLVREGLFDLSLNFQLDRLGNDLEIIKCVISELKDDGFIK